MQMQMQNAIQSMPEKQRRWTQDETDKVTKQENKKKYLKNSFERMPTLI